MRDRDPDKASRAGNVGLALLLSALLVLYLVPGPVVEALSGGRIAAETLAYSDSFASPWRMPWLVALLATLIGLQLVVAAQGQWRIATRWARITLTCSCGVQLGWHASYGTIFQDAQIDLLLIPAINAAAGVFAIVWVIELYREWSRVRPAPAPAADNGPAT